eukprot:SAG11_NODE_14745_length_601_cov_0.822709_1_plen_39_part_10
MPATRVVYDAVVSHFNALLRIVVPQVQIAIMKEKAREME